MNRVRYSRCLKSVFYTIIIVLLSSQLCCSAKDQNFRRRSYSFLCHDKMFFFYFYRNSFYSHNVVLKKIMYDCCKRFYCFYLFCGCCSQQRAESLLPKICTSLDQIHSATCISFLHLATYTIFKIWLSQVMEAFLCLSYSFLYLFPSLFGKHHSLPWLYECKLRSNKLHRVHL
jgi:hypothetical protein